MFGFLTSGAKEVADPLLSAKSVSGWLRQLPALDVIGRQQHVMRAFDAMRQSRKPVDLGRVQALELLDAALGADRRQLIKQYVENYDTSAKLAERIWQAIYDLSQGFIFAYQTALEEALRQGNNARWKPLTPLLFARLVHYYGTDAKLRVFRFERWIPAKWMELHRTYLRASELGFDRVHDGARERRAQRDAVDGRAGVPVRAADPPAQHGQHVAAAARLGDVAAARVEPQACSSTPCRGRPKGSSSTSPARRAWGAAPATIRDRCCAISTPRRSPIRSNAPSRRCDRPNRRTRVRPVRSTSCASRSWRRSVRRSRPI